MKDLIEKRKNEVIKAARDLNFIYENRSVSSSLFQDYLLILLEKVNQLNRIDHDSSSVVKFRMPEMFDHTKINYDEFGNEIPARSTLKRKLIEMRINNEI